MSNEIKFKIINDINRVIKKRHFFSMYSKDATVKYLENMASKGWLLCKVAGSSFYFREIEPATVTFDIHPFGTGITDTEYIGTENQEYIKECAKKGWKFVCEYDNNQFFYTINDGIQPLETDTNKIKNKIRNAYLKREVCIWMILELVLCFFTIGMDCIGYEEKDFFSIVQDNLREDIFFHILCVVSLILRIIKYCIFTAINKNNEINIKYLSQRTENIIAICEIALLCFVVIAYLISKAMVSIDELKSASDTLLMIVIIRLIYDISEDIKFKRMYKKQQVKNND